MNVKQEAVKQIQFRLYEYRMGVHYGEFHGHGICRRPVEEPCLAAFPRPSSSSFRLGVKDGIRLRRSRRQTLAGRVAR